VPANPALIKAKNKRRLFVQAIGASGRDEFQFQKGLMSPAGFNALSEFVSVPDSSEIFSSRKREGGAVSSSSFSLFPGQKG
jgi:hypothetical protein